MEDRKIVIEAVIEDFAEGAMTDHYESGAFVSYDATGLVIESPEPLAGRRLAVFHDEELPPGSPWREVGNRLRFAIRESQLAGDEVLFTGAAGSLEVLPREKGAPS